VTESDRIIKVGTLSKALGAQGGFICGSKPLISWLVNRARPYIFSTAIAPPVAGAGRRAVAIVRREPDRRGRLLALAKLLRDQLGSLGIPTGDSRCHILPIVVGEAAAAVGLSKSLMRHGLLVPAIRPPSVPVGTARLRISLTAAHNEEDIHRLAEALRRCRPALGGGIHAHR
jgi:8-amino-7-oxononanoate synthase